MFGLSTEFFTKSKLTEQQRKDSSVCAECFVSLDNYDELQKEAHEIQTKMTNLFHEKHRPETIFIKQEPLEDEESQEFSNMETDDGNRYDDKDLLQSVFFFKETSKRRYSESSETSSVNDNKKNLKKNDEFKTKRFLDCKQCDQTFTNRKEFLRHNKTHVPKEVNFHCEKCSNSYANDENLQIHLATDHADSPEGPFDCPICFKSIHNKYKLRQHFYIHRSNSSFLCFT